MVIAAATALFSEQICDYRMSKSLETKLALKATHGQIARMDDGYDQAIQTAIDVSTKVHSTTLNFFTKTVLPYVTSESKKEEKQVTPREGVRPAQPR